MSQEDTERTLFLTHLLADQERGEVAPVDDYVQRFPRIAAFVRSEYESLAAVGSQSGAERYRIERELAVGGMGEVRLATDTMLQRPVVVKTVRAGFDCQRASERLQREARVLSRLDHPHICRILDVLVRDGQLMLVLPYLQGRTLAEALAAARARSLHPIGVQLGDAPPSLPALLQWFAQVALAVDAAHEVGVVHRDLKPSNLFVQKDGSPVVLDFGLAQDSGAEDQSLTRTGEQLGTPLYMAPEQIEGRPCDRRTDVYALGVVLYEALTLHRPFEGETRQATFRQIMERDPLPPLLHNRTLPRDLEAVCRKAMAREPGRRYATARELADDLRRVLAFEATVARPESGITRIVRTVRRRRGVLAGSVLTALLLALISSWQSWVEAHGHSIELRTRVAEWKQLQAAIRELLDQGRWEELERTYEAARLSWPKDPLGMALQVQSADTIYRLFAKPASAITLLDECIPWLEASPDWPEEDRRAIIDVNIVMAQQRPEAGTRLDLLGWAHGRRGWIRARTGDFPGALTDLTKAGEILKPLGNWHRYTNALHIRGEVHMHLGDSQAAATDLDEAESLYKEPHFGEKGGETDFNGPSAIDVVRAGGLRAAGDLVPAAEKYLGFVRNWKHQNLKRGPKKESDAELVWTQSVPDLFADFDSDWNHDPAHAALCYAECSLLIHGPRPENAGAAAALDWFARSYGNDLHPDLLLHRSYVDVIERWIAKHDARRTLQDLVDLEGPMRSRGIRPGGFCEFFDLNARIAQVLAEARPGVLVMRTELTEHLDVRWFRDGAMGVTEFGRDNLAGGIAAARARSPAGEWYFVTDALLRDEPRAAVEQAGGHFLTNLADCIGP